jgi:MoaA/NifB/PqqE/SkfB family radical SAM enzyme
VAYAWEHLTSSEKSSILDAIARGAEPPPPRVVELSWQDRCNIDCFFCSTSDLRAGNFELSADTLESLFREMRTMGVRGVRLMGGGEPLFAGTPRR